MNSKIILNSQDYANLDRMSPEVQEYVEVLEKSARIDQPPGMSEIASSIHDPLTTQGSILTRVLVIILVALLIVGLIALAISVFTVH